MERPRALRPGGTVGIVAPSGPVNGEALERGLALLEGWGLVARVSPVVESSRGYLAGRCDAERAAALEQALADPALGAVWLARGGYGATRLLRLVDWARLRREAAPKIVCGYSDHTALHQAIRRELGWVTFHGPIAQVGSAMPAFTRECLWRAWTSREALGDLPLPGGAGALDGKGPWDGTTGVLRGGVATGSLAGGNLSLLAALCGTPWALQARGAIAILEDVNERPYRVDRMLVQLLQAGCLDGVAGIVFGHSPTCERDTAGSPSLTLREVLRDLLAPLGVPLVYGWPLGHTPYQWTLPLGVEARLDASTPGAERLMLLQPPCR